MLLHPYLGAMCGVVALAAFVRLTGGGVRRSTVALATFAGGLGAVLYLFGYIPQRLPEHPGDFGRASLNLMSLGVPFYSALSPSLPPGTLQDATGIQPDGANFLGIGVWLLLFLALAAAPKAMWALVVRHKALVVALAALAFYAPSNRCFFGQRLLYEYDIPTALLGPFENARATGRFFWPVGYALVFFVSCLVVRRFGRRGMGILAFAAMVQLLDSTACWTVVRNALAEPWRRELDWTVWSARLDGASRVNLYPAYGCWWPLDAPDRFFQQQRELEYLAASRGSRTNAGRTGRPVTDCAEDLRDRNLAIAGELRDGEVYVFFKIAYATEVLTMIGNDRCLETADSFVCAAGRRFTSTR